MASTMPPTSAACCAGQARHSRALRRHSAPTSKAAPQANIVMCSPEMLIRWATPVARKTSQSARSIAFWSPTTSAASRPAVLRSATCSNTASRTACRDAFDRMAPGCFQPLRRRVARAGAHVARGLQPLLPQPELVVEAVRVDVAVRRLQAHRHAPALAGVQLGSHPLQFQHAVGIGDRSPVPAQVDLRRHPHRRAGGRCVFDFQPEAQPGVVSLRHRRDHAGHVDVAALQLRLQAAGGELNGAQAAGCERDGGGNREDQHHLNARPEGAGAKASQGDEQHHDPARSAPA